MTNSEKMNAIFSLLEKKHVNLYHSISKKEFEKQKNVVLLDADRLSQKEFDYEMKRLFALFKDGHTSYERQTEYLKFDTDFIFRDGKVYAKFEQGGKTCVRQVVSLNGNNVKKAVYELSQLVPCETNAYKSFRVSQMLSSLYYLKLINVTPESSKYLRLDYLEGGRVCHKLMIAKENVKDFSNEIGYKSIKGVNYIKLGAIVEKENASIRALADKLDKLDIKKGEKFIVDLRGNTGGDLSLLNPVFDYLKKVEPNLTCLIDNGTFSSGRIAAVKCKELFNAGMIGEPSGGALVSCGYNNSELIDGVRVHYSIREFDFSSAFNGNKGSIIPDVIIKNSIKDIESGKDAVLERAVELVSITSKKDYTKENKSTLVVEKEK